MLACDDYIVQRQSSAMETTFYLSYNYHASLGHLGKYTNVILLPLIDELKLLRDEGVETYDVDEAHVILRVALMWTISNFLVYDR